MVVAYALLLVAWAFADPPGASPDESAHYVKAVAAGLGQIRGVADPTVTVPGADAVQTAWFRVVTRQYDIPGSLVPQNFSCEGLRPNVSAACHLAPVPPPTPGLVRAASYVGDYDPYLYVLPGAAMHMADGPVSALLAGRLVSAAVVLALLTLAVWLLLSPAGSTPLVGLGLAVTPMVMFLGSSLNPNGGEIAAGICFAAACLRLSRTQAPSRWVWLATGLSGAVLAMSRTLGPLWVAMILLVAVMLLGFRGTLTRLRTGGRWALVAVVTTTAGLCAALAWELVTHSHAGGGTQSIASRAFADLRALPGVTLPQQLGVFGYLDTPSPKPVYWLWELMLGAVLIAALVAGTARERVVLVCACVLSVAVTVAVAVFLIDPTGFPSQGRYTLPFVVVVPLLAAEVLTRHPDRLRGYGGTGLRVILVGVAAVQLISWWQNARRYAVGLQGPVWFLPSAQWAPPGGWWPWLALVLIAVAALAAPLLSFRRRGLR